MAIKNIEYDEALRAYMQKKGMSTIAVEVVSSQHSDIEVTELYVHLISEKQAAYFKEKKKFRPVAGELGEVLLPPYVLQYDEMIRFSLKTYWFIHVVRQTGIKL